MNSLLVVPNVCYEFYEKYGDYHDVKINFGVNMVEISNLKLNHNIMAVYIFSFPSKFYDDLHFRIIYKLKHYHYHCMYTCT